MSDTLKTEIEWKPIAQAPLDRYILVWPYWSDNLPAEVRWAAMKRKPGRWEHRGGFHNSYARPHFYCELPTTPDNL